MKVIDIVPKKLDLTLFKKRTALESDADEVIDYDCLITSNGVPKILYIKLNNNTDSLRWAVRTIKYTTGKRTRGLSIHSTIFGYRPKIPARQDYCSSAVMSRNFPKQHYYIVDYAKQLTTYYNNYFPDVFNKHTEEIKKRVMDEWTIAGTPFTSGIVNKDNPLKYHHDRGNFKGVLSNMVAFKKGVEGGRLVIPEYGIKLEIDDNTLTVFDGQSIMHGVSPFQKIDGGGYRYTIVYYSLEQMWKCNTINEELTRIRIVKKNREHKRLDVKHLEELKVIAFALRNKAKTEQHRNNRTITE